MHLRHILKSLVNITIYFCYLSKLSFFPTITDIFHAGVPNKLQKTKLQQVKIHNTHLKRIHGFYRKQKKKPVDQPLGNHLSQLQYPNIWAQSHTLCSYLSSTPLPENLNHNPKGYYYARIHRKVKMHSYTKGLYKVFRKFISWGNKTDFVCAR